MQIDAVSATRYKHVGVTPGQKITYRITAKRGTVYGPPSLTATVYGENNAPGANAESLSLQKAA